MVAVSAKWNYISRLLRETLDANHHPTTVFVSTIWTICWQNLRNGLYVANRGSLFMPSGFATLLPLFVIECVLAVLLVRTIALRERAAS